MDDEARTRIQLSVRQHYSQVARSSTENCCPDRPACCAPGYALQDLEAIPRAAVDSGRGCGNPLALASLRPGEVVLDLGSGGGLDVLLASQRVGAKGFVYGVDANPDMLDLARRNAAQAGADNVAFLPGDLEGIPLADQSVDVILSNCVLNLTLDKSRALNEAFRVLRPGGRLAVSDIVIDPDLAGFAHSESEIREQLDWASCSAGALTSGDLRSRLVASGFVEIELAVLYRMSGDDLAGMDAQASAGVSAAEVSEIASRFTSMAIRARRPATASA